MVVDFFKSELKNSGSSNSMSNNNQKGVVIDVTDD